MAKLFKNLDYDNDSVLVPSDLDGYATEAYISEELADYATKSDLFGEDGYITTLDNRVSTIERGLSGFATKSEIRSFVTRSDVEDMISEIPVASDIEDLSLSVSDMSVTVSDFSYRMKGLRVGEGRITFTRNNVTVGSFQVNQPEWSWFDIEVPTDVGDLTDNGGRFVTSIDLSRKIASLEQAMDSVGGGAAAAAASAYEAASTAGWNAWSQLRSETSASLDTVNSDMTGMFDSIGGTIGGMQGDIEMQKSLFGGYFSKDPSGWVFVPEQRMSTQISVITNQVTALGSGLTAIEWERSMLLEQGWMLNDDGTVSPVSQGTTFGELIALGGGIVFREAPSQPLAS